jgi:VIT1/CCC1 family predicted Fe2+/Mn2+ transporter
VLGANDGLISTASLMIGVAAAATDRSGILVAGVAGLTAGALSMAAGEFVSVSSQRDAERADLEKERDELERFPEAERAELAGIYEQRGLSPELAEEVAEQLSKQDRLAIHARDELGIVIDDLARPVQASVVSALSFVAGAVLPILVMAVASGARIAATVVATLLGLIGLGIAGARLGGAPPRRAAIRVLAGGAAALAVSLLIGTITGEVV